MPRGGRRRAPPPRISLGSVLVFLVLLFFFRDDLLQVLSGGPGRLEVPGGTPMGAPGPDPGGELHTSPAEEELVAFVSFVLDDLQDTWARILPGYREAKLVLFRDAVRSGCGFAQAQTSLLLPC